MIAAQNKTAKHRPTVLAVYNPASAGWKRLGKLSNPKVKLEACLG
jgi:hypothetical protein